MTNWLQRVGAMLGSGRTAAAPARAAAPAPTASASPPSLPGAASAPVGAEAGTSPDVVVPFVEWLLGVGPSFDAPLLPVERHLIAQLDGALAADAARADLLPRAPAVIPQLMNSLRDESQSSTALAARVAKDPHLVAEVLRLANSSATRGGEPVTDLSQAIGRLGTQGLRRAIAKVVLKPLFDAPSESLSGRAAPRLWQHSEAQAAECMRLMERAGAEPFEGYLAGLMHNVGWTAALRVLDRAGAARQPQFSIAFVHALDERREALFGLLVRPWKLTPALTALAGEVLHAGLSQTRSPLGQALWRADRQAASEVMGTQLMP